MNPSQFDAVIFDMDGLLIDTEPCSMAAWHSAALHFGHEIDDATLHGLIGRHREDCLDRIGSRMGMDLRTNGFIQRVEEIYFSHFMRHGISVKSGVRELLDVLAAKRIPRAVATSSEKDIAPRKLRLAGLEHYFPVIVSGCEVPHSKPAPDIFLLTAERLGVEPCRCLVLEDSYNGILGAKAAGMSPIMIPDLLAPTPESETLTLAVFESLAKAHPFLLERLATHQSSLE